MSCLTVQKFLYTQHFEILKVNKHKTLCKVDMTGKVVMNTSSINIT